MDSQFLRINLRNILNGLVVAVGSAVIITIQQWITNPNFDLLSITGADFKVLGTVAMSAGLAYLMKKVFSDESGKVGGVL